MSSIIERVKRLRLPLSEVVVIGGGILDALNLRQANDIDLAVSGRLFEELLSREGSEWRLSSAGDHLQQNDVEVWRGWSVDESFDYPFERLRDEAESIEGVMFASRKVVIKYKQQRASSKDLNDIALLEGLGE